MNESDLAPRRRDASQRVGFLLSQVGGFATARFAERLMVLGLQPSDVGILRLIFVEPGLSQQMLAARLGVGASRVVVLVDELEAKGLIARQRSTKDRRNYELQLTDAGTEVMSRMREIGADHENDLVKALSAEERGTLAVLLNKISHSHALTPDVHPGYRNSAGQ